MKNITIDKLETSTSVADFEFVGNTQSGTQKLSFATITENIKKELGMYTRVLEKCSWCGQWGAVMCACPNCGAPIDPKN